MIDSLEQHYSNVDTQIEYEKLCNFFYYNDTLDRVRGSKLVEYIPELEECRKYIKQH